MRTVSSGIGTMASELAAAMGPRSRFRAETKPAMETGRIFAPSPASITGIRNSFQASSAMKTVVAALPGAAGGRKIRVRITSRLTPSTSAPQPARQGEEERFDLVATPAPDRLWQGFRCHLSAPERRAAVVGSHRRPGPPEARPGRPFGSAALARQDRYQPLLQGVLR